MNVLPVSCCAQYLDDKTNKSFLVSTRLCCGKRCRHMIMAASGANARGVPTHIKKPTCSPNQGDELDNRRCSCGFPETDVECESLLLANVPTASMTDSGFGSSTEDGEGGTGSANGGAGDGGTPTWVIIVAIALVVLMAMMTYGAVVWRRRILSRRKAGGVDDFFGDISGGDRRSERRADSGKRADSDRRTDSEGRASFGRRVDQI